MKDTNKNNKYFSERMKNPAETKKFLENLKKMMEELEK